MTKKSFPLSRVYQLLEPGPIVLVTTLPQRPSQQHDAVVAHDDGICAAAGGV